MTQQFQLDNDIYEEVFGVNSPADLEAQGRRFRKVAPANGALATAPAGEAPQPPTYEQQALGMARAYGVLGKEDPDGEARDREAARILDVPDWAVQASPEVRKAAQEVARVKLNSPKDWEGLIAEYPATARYLSNRSNMILSQDDINNITSHERTLRALGRAYRSGEASIELGEQGWEALNGRGNGDTWYRIAQLQQELQDSQKDKPDAFSISGTLYRFMEFAPQIADQMLHGAKVGIPAGLTVGGLTAATGVGAPAAMPAGMAAASKGFWAGSAYRQGQLMAGQSYAQIKNLKDASGKPIDDSAAMIASTFVGAINAGLGMAQLGSLLKTIPGGEKVFGKFSQSVADRVLDVASQRVAMSTFARSWLATFIEQEAIMGAIEATNYAGEKAAITLAENMAGQNIQNPDDRGLWERTSGAALEMGPVAALMGLPGHGMRLMRDTGRVEAADRQMAHLQELGEAIKDSKTLDRYAPAYRNMIEEAVADGPIQEVRVPAKQFIEYFQRQDQAHPEVAQQIADKLGVGDKLAEAVATGDDLVIGLSDFASVLGKTDHYNNLLPDIRFREGDFTMRERKALEAKEKRGMMTAYEALVAGDIENPAVTDTHRVVFENVKQKALGAGLGEHEAISNAALYWCGRCRWASCCMSAGRPKTSCIIGRC